jgi:peptidoglycan/xylan/chitin deacetylase (PgdA/CDA1 family)
MRDILVLCYHGISDTWPAGITVEPARLEEQLADFMRRGYRGATFSQALTNPPARKTLVVTFDDAHASVATRAAPILAGLGLVGTVYVPTDYPDSGRLMGWDGYDMWLGTEYEQELACLGWDQLRELHDAGWEIGSHTRSHPRLPELSTAEIAAELTESRQRCEEEISAPCLSLAYPYGEFDERAVLAAREAGYRFAATIPRKPQPPLPLRWPRVGVYRDDDSRRIRWRVRARRLAPDPAAQAALALRSLRK